MEPKLPTPAYRSPVDFACSHCRTALDHLPYGRRELPDVLMPVAEHFEQPLLPWTESFFACRQCQAIWAVSFNPKDMILEMTPTPEGMAQALLPGASLDQVMVPLFAWAPVDEMTESALWQTRYEPQRLFDRLLAAWPHTRSDVNRRMDIIRQLARLLSANNPYHRGLQQQRGWLIESHRSFDATLANLNQDLIHRRPPWAHVPDHVRENVSSLLNKLQQPEVVRDLQRRTSKPVDNTGGAQTVQAADRHAAPSSKRADQVAHRTVWARCFELLTPYSSFLPAVLCAWLIERIILQLPLQAQAGGGLLWVLVLVLHGVAVMRNSGVGTRPLAYLVWHRLSAIGDYLVFAVLVFCLVVVGTAIASLTGFEVASVPPAWQAVLITACGGLLLVRLWPFWVIPYMQRVEDDVPSPRAYGITRRSALLTAWQLTGHRTVLMRLTLPWMLMVAVSAILCAAVGLVAGDWGRFALLHAVILPVWMALTWTLVERLTGSPLQAD